MKTEIFQIIIRDYIDGEGFISRSIWAPAGRLKANAPTVVINGREHGVLGQGSVSARRTLIRSCVTGTGVFLAHPAQNMERLRVASWAEDRRYWESF